MLSQFHDTIAALSTPEGRSALAVVRISGPDAIRIVSNVVSDRESLLVARGGASVYTNIEVSHPTPGNSIGAFIVDDVLIHVYRAPRSFTGEDLCEITSHGSPVIAQEILSLLVF
jgi:tRNA modification GTPase